METTFTYHDPCHLGRGQGIKKQPRDLLRAAGTFVEMKEADVCCGGAGSFHLDYPDIASTILDRKRANIEKTGAAIIVTGCRVPDPADQGGESQRWKIQGHAHQSGDLR